MIQFNVNTQRMQIDVNGMVTRAMQKSSRPLNRIGAVVRLSAHRLTNKKRRKMFYSEMPPDVARWWRRNGGKKGRYAVQFPLASSKPGESPRMIRGNITNPQRRGVIYQVDPPLMTSNTRSVVVGPQKLRTAVPPRALEEGGYSGFLTNTKAHMVPPKKKPKRVYRMHLIRSRQYMVKAMSNNQKKFEGYFRNFFK